MTVYNRLEGQDSFPFNPQKKQPLEILLTPNGQYLQLSLHEFIALLVISKYAMKTAAPLSPHFFLLVLLLEVFRAKEQKKRGINVGNFKAVLMRKEEDLLYYLSFPTLVFPALISSAVISHISNILRKKSSPNYFLKTAS